MITPNVTGMSPGNLHAHKGLIIIIIIIIIILLHYHKRLKCQGIFPTPGVIGLASPSFPGLFVKVSIQTNLCKAIWKDLKC